MKKALLLDKNDMAFDLVNYGGDDVQDKSLPSFVRDRNPRVIEDFTGEFIAGWKWDGTKLVDPNPPVEQDEAPQGEPRVID